MVVFVFVFFNSHIILFNNLLILFFTINSTEGVEEFWVFVLPFFFLLNSILLPLKTRRRLHAQETQSHFLSKLENVAEPRKNDRSLTWEQLGRTGGGGGDRWSFLPHISVIYNRTRMTRKKWDAIWKLPYKIESVPNKDIQQDGEIKKKIKMDPEWWRSQNCP